MEDDKYEPYEPSLGEVAESISDLIARVDWLIASQNELKQSMQKMMAEMTVNKIESGEKDLF